MGEMVSDMKTCIVTGGAGFIGSWLCGSLLEKGYKVICFDNLVTGNKENIPHLLDKENFSFSALDISKGIEIEGEADYIFHMASPASPIDYQKLPIETMMANSLGTLNALNLAVDKKARILLASTSEVYGDPKVHPQVETYWGNVNPIGPRSCYDESKRYAEALAMSYRQVHGIDVRLARIFNTYGPRMRNNDGRVIPNFLDQALTGKPLTIYGDGKQTRSFCYVTDLVEGIEKLMFTEGLSGEVFNMGNPGEYSILELAEIVKEAAGSSSQLTFQDLPIDDPTRRKPNIDKAKAKLSWEPRIDLRTGIKKMLD